MGRPPPPHFGHPKCLIFPVCGGARTERRPPFVGVAVHPTVPKFCSCADPLFGHFAYGSNLSFAKILANKIVQSDLACISQSSKG
jgi:hypothetical protein